MNSFFIVTDSSSKWVPNIVSDCITDLTEKYPQGIKSEEILDKYEVRA